MPDAKRRLPPSVISSRTTAHSSHLTNDLVLRPSDLRPKTPLIFIFILIQQLPAKACLFQGPNHLTRLHVNLPGRVM